MLVLSLLSVLAGVHAVDNKASGGAGEWLPEEESIVAVLEAAGLTGCSGELELPSGQSLTGYGSEGISSSAWKGKPFVDHSSALGKAHRWQSRAALLEDVGNRVAEIRWPSGANVLGVISRLSTITNFVKSGMHAAEGGLLFDHMATPEGLDIPPIFEEAFLNETVLSIGAAGAGLPFHNHATAWQSVVHGAKLFLLLPPLNENEWPEAAKATRKGGDGWSELVAAFRELVLPKPLDMVKYHLDSFLSKVPQSVRGRLRHCILRPGDTIFIPCNYYHATLNLADTVAIGGQTGDATWREQDCSPDIFGAATTRYMSSKTVEDVAEACKLNPYQLQCVLTLAQKMTKKGDPAGALAAISAAADRFSSASGLLPPLGASIVLGGLAGHVAKIPDLQKVPGAMQKAATWVKQAADLDSGMCNMQAHLMHLSLQFAQAASAARHLSSSGGRKDAKERAASKRKVTAAMQSAHTRALHIGAAIERAQFEDLNALPTERLHKLGAARGLNLLASTPASTSEHLKRLVMRAGLTDWWESTENKQGGNGGTRGGSGSMVLSYTYGGKPTDYTMLEVQLAQLLQAVSSGSQRNQPSKTKQKTNREKKDEL